MGVRESGRERWEGEGREREGERERPHHCPCPSDNAPSPPQFRLHGYGPGAGRRYGMHCDGLRNDMHFVFFALLIRRAATGSGFCKYTEL